MKMMQQKRTAQRLALGLMVLVSTATLAADDDSYLTLMLGYDSSSGKYGTATTTDIVSVPVSALYETGRWGLKLTVPYIQVTGDGSVLASGGRGRRTTTTTTTTRTTNSGLGDVLALVTYNVFAAESVDAGVDLTGRIKFGTANKTLGTGKNDYAAMLYAYHTIRNFMPSVSVGYDVLGSTDAAPLQNVYFGSVAGDYQFSESTNGGLEYRYSQKASVTSAEQRELVMYANRQIGRDTFLRGYLLKGYADGSPDSGFGISISTTY